MKYPGGKGQTFQTLINLMPPHSVFIETHLGGGAVIRKKRLAKNGNIGIEIDPKVLERWSPIDHQGIELIQDDAINYLKRYKFTGDELIYSDPPYLRETRRRKCKFYKHEYTTEQHIELLTLLKSLPCMVMISGYESKLYEEYLCDWHFETFYAVTHTGKGKEWVWMNYPRPSQLHDYSYLGDDFRERYRIKGTIKSLSTRIQSLPEIERQALYSSLASISKPVNP